MAHYFVLWTAHYFSSHRALLCPMDKTLLQVQWCTIFTYWTKKCDWFDGELFWLVDEMLLEVWLYNVSPGGEMMLQVHTSSLTMTRSPKKEKRKKKDENKGWVEKSQVVKIICYSYWSILYMPDILYIKQRKKRIETIGVNPWPTGSCYSACLRPWTGHWLAVCNANHGSSGNSYSGDKIYWLFIGTYILYARDFT